MRVVSGRRDDDNGSDNAASDRPTRTPTATAERTPTPIRTPTPSRTPTPEPTATPRPRPPEITGTEPASAICNQELLIEGRHFGASRQAVDGQVRITGVRVQVYVAWSARAIRVVVPEGVQTGAAKTLHVDTAGGSAGHTLTVSC